MTQPNEQKNTSKMLLITARVWFGPGRYWPQHIEFRGQHERLEGIATRLTLPQAIAKIKSVSNEFGGNQGLSAVEYHIVSVTEIESLTDEQIHDAGMLLTENLNWSDD